MRQTSFKLALPFFIVASLFLSSQLLAADSHQPLPIASSLFKDALLAKKGQRPILLMISQDHCPFCDLLKREVLHPMMISGDYDDKVVIRELFIDLSDSVQDFNNQKVDAADFAHSYNVYVTPTLLFLDQQGHELAKRLVGVNTVEMFSYYLDSAIDEAQGKLRAQNAKTEALALGTPD